MVSMFIQFEIMALKALIAIKPFGTQLEYIGIAFGILAVICVAAVLIVIAILVALCAIPALIIAFFINLAAQLGEAWDMITAGVSAAFDWVSGVVTQAIDFFKGLSLAQIGSDLIDGLVNGIMSAGPKVLGAITGLASGAINAAKKALGIASPSTIFAEIGMHTAAGMEQGVDGGADGVQGSMEAMVAPPAAAGAGAGAAAGASSSSKGSAGAGVVIENLNITSATDDPKGFASALRDALADLMTQGGASHAPAT